MEIPIHTTIPDADGTSRRWVLVSDPALGDDYVREDHVTHNAHLSGKPYVRELKRMGVGEFLGTNQDPRAKRKLQAILEKQG